MKVELEKDDLVSLVIGTVPCYNVFDHHLVQKTGRYIGGHVDSWKWDRSEVEKLTQEDLWDLYQLCKLSWK